MSNELSGSKYDQRHDELILIAHAGHSQVLDGMQPLSQSHKFHPCSHGRAGQERTAPYVVLKGHKSWRLCKMSREGLSKGCLLSRISISA